MNNLLSAYFQRLIKSKLYWCLLGLMILSGIIIPILAHREMIAYGTDYTLESRLVWHFLIIGFIVAIFCSWFLGTDYSDGTIRNKIIAGNSRLKIYISALLICVIASVILVVVRNTYYTPVAYVHNLCREYSSITTSLECTSETIALEKHEERYMFSAERLKNKLLIPLKGDVPLDKIVDGYKLFLSNPKRKSFEEYKDIALVCGWYGEKKILDDILEYIWNNVQKDKNHPFFRNKDRGVEGWFEKIREESSDCERLHEICEKEIQKHKVGKLPYRNII